jgi:hypothetical protein
MGVICHPLALERLAASALSGSPPRGLLGDQQRFRVFLGDHQEFKRGLAWTARALLPAPYGICLAHFSTCVLNIEIVTRTVGKR